MCYGHQDWGCREESNNVEETAFEKERGLHKIKKIIIALNNNRISLIHPHMGSIMDNTTMKHRQTVIFNVIYH